MVTKGSTSAYTIWVHMENEPGKYVISYKNVGKRVVKLGKHNLLKEIKLKGIENLHGRKDYVITMKGFQILVPYILEHPQSMQSIVRYIDKFGIDKYQFGMLLKEGYVNAIEALNAYHEFTNSLYYPFGIKEIKEIKEWYNKYGDLHEVNKMLTPKIISALHQMTSDMNFDTNIHRKIANAQERMQNNMIHAQKDGDELTKQFDAEKET